MLAKWPACSTMTKVEFCVLEADLGDPNKLLDPLLPAAAPRAPLASSWTYPNNTNKKSRQSKRNIYTEGNYGDSIKTHRVT